MEPNKLNKIITEAVFGVLIVVPLVIGLSLYSRPAPPPPPPPITPVYPRPTAIPTPIATPITQNRLYVYGFAYDSITQQPISAGQNIKSDTGNEVSTQGGGAFYIPAEPSLTKIVLNIEGYKPKELNIGTGYNLSNIMQEVGKVYFDPANLESAKPVEIFSKIDANGKTYKLYFIDPVSKQQKLLNSDVVESFKQSPDFKSLAYVFRDSQGNYGVKVIFVNRPEQKSGSSYNAVDLKQSSQIKILEWSKNSCCVLWQSNDVKIGNWGSYLNYYNRDTDTLGYILNAKNSKNMFEKIGRVVYSPGGDLVALEYFFTGTDGIYYKGYETMGVNGSGSSSEGKADSWEIKDFYFDEQGRLCSWEYYSTLPGGQQNFWTRYDPKTAALETSFTKPAYWKN